ncbi:MAG: hypothetical protein ABSA63_06165 [Thermoplasmata archaeon]
MSPHLVYLILAGTFRKGAIDVTFPAPPTQGSTPSASAPFPPSTSISRAPGRRPRKGLLLTAAVISVVGIVVLALLFTAVIPGLKSSPHGSPSIALSYSRARTLADPAAAATPGGPWTLREASAADANTALMWGAIYDATCGVGPDFHFLTSVQPRIPVFDGSLASGLSPSWLFQYSNGTSAPEGIYSLAVIVVNGTAIPWVTFLTACLASDSLPFVALPATGIVDSPTALAAAVNSSASFINAHPGLNASFDLIQGYFNATEGYWWSVTLTTCAPVPFPSALGGPPSDGTSLDEYVNATSGLPPLQAGSVLSGPIC